MFGNKTDEMMKQVYGPSGTGLVRDMCLWGDKNRILQVLMNLTSNQSEIHSGRRLGRGPNTLCRATRGDCKQTTKHKEDIPAVTTITYIQAVIRQKERAKLKWIVSTTGFATTQRQCN